MRRRIDTDININHERWLVSYSDFVTLLFAFFVVLYSISHVNENKYKTLSEAMSEVFSDPKRSLNPIQVGELVRSNTPSIIEQSNVNEVKADTHISQGDDGGEGVLDQSAGLPQLSDQFNDEFSDLIDSDVIQVNSNEYWLEISLNNSILFPLGSVNTSTSAEKVVSEIADILKPFNNPIQVEGYTDNIAVSSAQFPSNWELSSARAAAILKILTANGVAPERLSAVGYGEHHPIAENDTAEGREKNRRVVLMIAREKTNRPQVKTAEAINNAISPSRAELDNVGAQQNVDRTIDTLISENPDLAIGTLLDEVNIQNQTGNTVDNSLEINDTIVPVETENGGLLFSSDPNR